MSEKEIKSITTPPDKEFTPLNYSQPEIQIEPKLLNRILEATQKQLEVIKSREERAKVWDAARQLAKTAIKKGQTAEEVIKEANADHHSAKLIEKIYLSLTETKEKTTKFKRRTFQRIMFALVSLSMILAACVPQSEEKPPTETEPIVTLPADLPETDEPVTQEPPTKEAPATATSIPIGDVNLTYSSQYIGYELEANVFVANNWPASLSGEALSKFGNIALISNYEVSDISNNPRGLILKIVGDGWEEGTHVMESPFVSGELLFMTTSYASEQLGVEVASFEIGADSAPVAVDANGNVVGYVEYDSATGTTTYVKGNKDKAPNAVKIEKDYFDMSVEERLAQSQGHVEKANTYDGEVKVFPEEIVKGLNVVGSPEDYPTYWSPTAQGTYGLGFNGSWRSAHNTPEGELDKTGESFPDQTFPGYENPDGTLVMIDPETGVETTFGKVFVPGHDEMTIREFYAMHNQDQFGKILTESLLSNSNISPEDKWYQWTQDSLSTSVFLPGFIHGQNNFYSTLSGAGSGGNEELPEEGWMYREVPTNSFVIPISSPEKEGIMLWLNVQQGNMVKTLTVEYSEESTAYFDSVTNSGQSSFGASNQDQFGILIEDRNPKQSHARGGAKYLLQGNQGIGDITDIERILNASTEREVLDIIGEFKIFVSSPFQIAFPER